jgi:ADP-ribose pyrophosphatase YjhB (NUDIX family)
VFRKLVYPLANRLLLQPFSRISRGKTLGVRGVAIDEEGRLLVVKQTYTNGWIFPGGGIERGETAIESLSREMDEEAAVKVTGQPVMHGLFSNDRHFPGDHVAVYLVPQFTVQAWKPSLEISHRAFLPRDQIERDCSDAMKRRLAELLDGAEISGIW